MVKAMNTKVGNALRKLVLIKLADHANDKGICWPSYEHIAGQCEMSKRTVIRHIDELEKQGLIKVVQRKRNGEAHNRSNLYFLCLNHSDNLATDSDNLSKTIMTQCHPNQSLITSHKKESIIKEKIYKKELDLSLFYQKPNKKIWDDYLEHRKNKKAKLTQTALNRLIEEINKANKFGYSTNSVLAECMLRNWHGFKTEWIEKDQQRISIETINHVSNSSSNPPGFKVING